MPRKIIYERLLWFYGQIKSDRYPNAGDLAAKFEVCRKTAQRDIAFIRDRMHAPLVYVPDKRGYTYEDKSCPLPGIWLSEQELGALFISSRLAATIPDRKSKTALNRFLKQIISAHSLSSPLSLNQLCEKISVKNIEYAKVDNGIFATVVDALFYPKSLSIEYFSPHKNESTQRTIAPLHLLQYMGNWHLVAHCFLRNNLRDFALSRIRAIRPTALKRPHRSSHASIKTYLRKNFGLMSDETRMQVCLKFSAEIVSWVSEQIWHPKQTQTRTADGSLCLTFPVADLREVKREILKFGAQVEVLSPEALRREVRDEIEKMTQIYP